MDFEPSESMRNIPLVQDSSLVGCPAVHLEAWRGHEEHSTCTRQAGLGEGLAQAPHHVNSPLLLSLSPAAAVTCEITPHIS